MNNGPEPKNTAAMTFQSQLLSHLAEIQILPRRLLLQLPDADATVPMLRGVWGAALHDLDQDAYARVFAPSQNGSQHSVPLYLMRPAPPDPNGSAIDFFLFGEGIELDPVLGNAWRSACEKGLGPTRTPFQILGANCLPPRMENVEPLGLNSVWSLDQALGPFDDAGLIDTPCRLRFATPVRLIRNDRLIECPTLADVAIAAHRRVCSLLPRERRAEWDALREDLISFARKTSCGAWRGDPVDVERYSGRQRRKVVMKGVVGEMDLPTGAGVLAPLLAVLPWTHVGKGTIVGLGAVAFLSAAASSGNGSMRSIEHSSPPPGGSEVVFYSIGVDRRIRPDTPLPPLPPIPSGALVVVEGRAPTWRYGAALCAIQSSPAGAVAVYDPRLGAVVIFSRSAEYRESQVVDVSRSLEPGLRELQ